jgi:hypothetical protein
VTVTASDTSEVDGTAGALAVGGVAGVERRSRSTSSTTWSRPTPTARTPQPPGSSITIDAGTDVDVDAFAIGFSFAGLLSGFVNYTSNEVTSETAAAARGGGTLAGDTFTVEATDTSELDTDATAVAFGGLAGVGGSYGANKTATEVSAGIGGATVTTDVGAVTVDARSTLDVDSLALAFSGSGLIGGVGTATFVDAANTTRAYIDGGSTVTSATSVFLDARDNSTFHADSGGASVSGLVDVGLSFASSKAINDVRAIIDGSGTTVTALGLAGTVDLDATFDAEIDANAIGFSASGFAAASGGIAVVESGGTTEAAITGGATVNAATVSMDADAEPAVLDADAGGFNLAGFAAAGLMVAESVAGHSARAEATGIITTGQLDVLADATRQGSADANFLGISSFTGEVAFEAEHTAGTTEAVIGEGADITIIGGGNVTVSAESTDTADPTITDIVFPNLGNISAQAASAVVASSTRTRVAGRVRNANTVNVTSVANKLADALVTVLSFSFVSLSGVALDNIADALPDDLPIPILPPFDTAAIATVGGDNEAALGTGADIEASGGLTLTATSSTNDAFADIDGGGATFVNVIDSATQATVGGSTRVQIEDGVTLDVDTLTSRAFADTNAEAGAVYVGASGANVQLAEISALTNHAVIAGLGPRLGNNPAAGDPTNLTIDSGALLLDAESESDATVNQFTFEASALTVNRVKPRAEAGGTTVAHLGGEFIIEADSVTASAVSDNTATSEALAFEIGAIEFDDSEKSVSTSHATEALVSPRADITFAGGIVTLTADSTNDATIDTVAPLDIGAVDLNFVKSTAEVGGWTLAYLDEGASVEAADLNATATSDNTAEVSSFEFEISAFNLDAASPVARTAHRTEAFTGPVVGAVAVFDPSAAVSADSDTINIGRLLPGLSDGDAVVYSVNFETAVGGLASGATYYVNVDAADPNAVKVKLFADRDDALAGTNAIGLTLEGTTGDFHFLTKSEAPSDEVVGQLDLDNALDLFADSTSDAAIDSISIALGAFNITDMTPEITVGGATAPTWGQLRHTRPRRGGRRRVDQYGEFHRGRHRAEPDHGNHAEDDAADHPRHGGVRLPRGGLRRGRRRHRPGCDVHQRGGFRPLRLRDRRLRDHQPRAGGQRRGRDAGLRSRRRRHRRRRRGSGRRRDQHRDGREQRHLGGRVDHHQRQADRADHARDRGLRGSPQRHRARWRPRGQHRRRRRDREPAGDHVEQRGRDGRLHDQRRRGGHRGRRADDQRRRRDAGPPGRQLRDHRGISRGPRRLAIEPGGDRDLRPQDRGVRRQLRHLVGQGRAPDRGVRRVRCEPRGRRRPAAGGHVDRPRRDRHAGHQHRRDQRRQPACRGRGAGHDARVRRRQRRDRRRQRYAERRLHRQRGDRRPDRHRRRAVQFDPTGTARQQRPQRRGDHRRRVRHRHRRRRADADGDLRPDRDREAGGSA